MDGSGGEIASYAQGQNIDEVLAMDRSGTVDYYEQDGLGSVTSLTASNATLAQTYTYDSFGNTTNSTGSLTNFFQYTGRESDTETGLYYYRARYYDPSIGRFVSEDPIQFFGGVDFYEYAVNNPLSFVDPFGFSTLLFNRSVGTLTLYGRDGNPVEMCEAHNYTDSRSNGPWPNGNYPYQGHKPHPPDPNGRVAHSLASQWEHATRKGLENSSVQSPPTPTTARTTPLQIRAPTTPQRSRAQPQPRPHPLRTKP